MIFFNDTATTEIYTLSLHDALPIWLCEEAAPGTAYRGPGIQSMSHSCSLRLLSSFSKRRQSVRTNLVRTHGALVIREIDRKSTRLNSSHANISYVVFCLKNKSYTSL